MQAAHYYATGSVAWTLGDVVHTMIGGINRKSGVESRIELHPIVATRGPVLPGLVMASTCSLTNEALFKRDRHTCAYCTGVFQDSDLTCDHIVPVSKGGRSTWTNVATTCRRCNSAKGDRTLDQLGWKLAYVPYRPNLYEGMLLRGRKVIACQHDFLKNGLPAHSRLH